jgi:hypothetical protein
MGCATLMRAAQQRRRAGVDGQVQHRDLPPSGFANGRIRPRHSSRLVEGTYEITMRFEEASPKPAPADDAND